jgi:hypothetical protein
MHKLVSIGALAGALAFAGVASAEPAAAPAGAKPAVPAAADAAAHEKKVLLGSPGEGHQILARTVGKWNVALKIVKAPGAPAQDASGTAELTAMYDGRFIRQDYSANYDGHPFSGTGYTGYDNEKKQYRFTWIDSAHTSLMSCTGKLEKDGKTITFAEDKPMAGEKPGKVVWRWVDDKTWVYESYDRDKGKEWKVLEITYTRAP